MKSHLYVESLGMTFVFALYILDEAVNGFYVRYCHMYKYVCAALDTLSNSVSFPGYSCTLN
jgi:hypothetical protein